MSFAGMTDDGIVADLAKRIRQYRLNANMTQDEVAAEAGIGKATYVRFESGSSTAIRLTSLIAILRKLDLLDNLDSLVPEPEISPLQVAKMQGKKRQRASGRRQEQQEEDDLEW